MIKRYILTFICSLLSLHIGFSQSNNREVYVTYGTNFLDFSVNDEKNFTNSNQWPINYSSPGLADVPQGKRNFLTSKGSLTIGFNMLKNRHKFGAYLYYESQEMFHKTSQFSVDIDTGESTLTGLKPWSESLISNLGLSARYQFTWLNKKKIKLYSGLSSGIVLRRSKTSYYQVQDFQVDFPETLEDFLRYKDSEYNLSFHFNGIGIRYGEVTALLIELGIGNRGYLNVGISHFFN